MFIPVTVISICVLVGLLIKLGLNVVKLRRGHKIAFGDGKNEELIKAMRGQANLCEYGPLGVLLILGAELQAANIWVLGVLAAAFLTGRAMHAYAFSNDNNHMTPRVRGMQLTIYSMFALVALNLITLILKIV